jgi:hypothetical protein
LAEKPKVTEKKYSFRAAGWWLRGLRHDFTTLVPSLTGPAGSAGSPARSCCCTMCWQTPHSIFTSTTAV